MLPGIKILTSKYNDILDTIILNWKTNTQSFLWKLEFEGIGKWLYFFKIEFEISLDQKFYIFMYGHLSLNLILNLLYLSDNFYLHIFWLCQGVDDLR